MVIGQFVDTYPPQVDGVGRVTQAYCQTLGRMGHEVYYIAPKNGQVEDPKDIQVILSASMRMPGELFRIGLPGLDASFHKQLNEISFDIVHAQSPFLAGHEARLIAKKRDIPLVSTFHSKYYDDVLIKTKSRFLAESVTKKLVHFYDSCDGVWTVNNATAQVLHDYGYRGKILIMENGTNEEFPSEEGKKRLMERISIQEHVPILLFVGQHNYKKNLHGILGACRLLKERGMPFQLLTAGDGPDYDAIVKEAETLGIRSQVQFLGFMRDRDELMALYHLADLLVFPSLYDNAPMVLREAAVMRTPGLVVRNSCSAEGVIDGYNGFISPDESAESICETIVRALPDVETVGEQARQTIPVSWDIILQRVVAEYERLIDCHSGDN